MPKQDRLKILRLYGRTHEKEDYPDPFDKIQTPFSFGQHNRVRPEFKNDSLHCKIRIREPDIEALRIRYTEDIERNRLPSRVKQRE